LTRTNPVSAGVSLLGALWLDNAIKESPTFSEENRRHSLIALSTANRLDILDCNGRHAACPGEIGGPDRLVMGTKG